MPRKALATRVDEDIADHVEQVADSPTTEYDSRSDVLRKIVRDTFDDEQ